jgi:hypothetical protein
MAEIYEPWHSGDISREKARKYYGLDEKDPGQDLRIESWIYGGEQLSPQYSELVFGDHDAVARTVTVRLVKNQAPKDIVLEGISFRQLLVESSGPGPAKPPTGDTDLWEFLGVPQRRLEINQNELARWSVRFDRRRNWNGAAVSSVPDEIQVIELINNCTTENGFEIKLSGRDGRLWHGSVTLPRRAYLELSQAQAGAWPHQFTGDPMYFEGEPGYPGGDTSFSGIYFDPHHANKDVIVDLGRYRSRQELIIDPAPNVEISRHDERIQYMRWGGEAAEYYQKPHVRRLIASASDVAFQTPPTHYEEILEGVGNGNFRLADFEVNGLYDVTSPVSKNLYPQLAKLTRATVWKTAEGLHELVIENPEADPEKLELHRVVIGNISLSQLGKRSRYRVVDRFGFNPRPTVTSYDANWRPANEQDGGIENAPYAWLLARPEKGGAEQGVYIQSESWGVERAILSLDDLDPRKLVVDLISFERIVPVWRARIDLGALLAQEILT